MWYISGIEVLKIQSYRFSKPYVISKHDVSTIVDFLLGT